MRFQNGCNKVAIKLRVVQFWSEIILVISNQILAARSFDFEITRMISDQIARPEVQLPLNYIHPIKLKSLNASYLSHKVLKRDRIVSCILLKSNQMIFLVQFGINKHS